MRRRGCRRGTRKMESSVIAFFPFLRSLCSDLEVGGLYDSGSRWTDVPCEETLVGDMRERSNGQGSPDIAVPAKFDQFFICGFISVAVPRRGGEWWGGGGGGGGCGLSNLSLPT